MKKSVDGTFVDTDYDANLMAFVHEECEIRNPFISECGRFAVDPAVAYGFYPHHTGGGCMALVKSLEDGRQIWLTDEGGSEIPEAHEVDSAILGVFMNGEQVAYIEIADIPMESDVPAKAAEPLKRKSTTKHADNEPGI